MRIWELPPADDFPVLHHSARAPLGFLPGERVLSTVETDRLCLWDGRTGVPLDLLDVVAPGEAPRKVTVIASDAAGTLFLAGTYGAEKSRLRVWDARTMEPRFDLDGIPYGVYDAAVSPDGRWLVTASVRGELVLWSAATGERVRTLAEGERGEVALAFHPNSARLALVDGPGVVRLLSLEGDELWRTESRWGGGDLAFDPDGERLVCGTFKFGEAHDARVLDAGTGAPLDSLDGHGSYVSAVGFLPDGTRVVTGCEDGVVRLWEADTGAHLLNLEGPPGPHVTVGFDLEGQRLFACSKGEVRFWNSAETGRGEAAERSLLRQAWERVRPLTRSAADPGRLLDALDGEGALEPALRSRAALLAELALQDNAPLLNHWSWSAVVHRGRTEAEYELARIQAERALEIDAGNLAYQSTAGVACFRSGLIDVAEEILAFVYGERKACEDGLVHALALDHLGRAEEAVARAHEALQVAGEQEREGELSWAGRILREEVREHFSGRLRQ